MLWWSVVYYFCIFFSSGVCILQLQDALVSQLSAPPAALCAAPVVHQERKEQAASVDQGNIGLHGRPGAVTLL